MQAVPYLSKSKSNAKKGIYNKVCFLFIRKVAKKRLDFLVVPIFRILASTTHHSTQPKNIGTFINFGFLLAFSRKLILSSFFFVKLLNAVDFF